MKHIWTLDEVKDRIREAVNTLARLPMDGLRPAGYRSFWPDVVHDKNEAYGWEAATINSSPVSAREITRMDEVLEWMRWLDKDRAAVVWMHAEGRDRMDIQLKVGAAKTKVWSLWKSGLGVIVGRLNAKRTVRTDSPERI